MKRSKIYMVMIAAVLAVGFGCSSLYAQNWDTAFGNPGIAGDVKALAVDGSGNLYAGGNFTTVGVVGANRIAKWDGSAWSALDTGMNGYVYALAVDGSGNLYAGGNFTTAGGVSVNYIAKWDGSAWSALGSGMDSDVHVLACDGSGNLYAGGSLRVTAAGICMPGEFF